MDALFLKACRGEHTERTPMWVMRQAGRYLPEYREVREKADFMTLCRTPELAAKVTLQPIDRFGLDASILFADIMTPLESMGVELEFTPGPKVAHPIASMADVAKLRVPEKDEITPFVMETVRILVRELDPRGVPLIGFCGAPLTLAAYLVEGKGSKDFSKLRSFLYAEPEAATALLDKLAEVMGRYVRAQVEAGARAVQVFDSWAGILSERDYRRFALPAVQKVFRGLDGIDVPKIFFAQDAAAFFALTPESGADVIGVDWRIELPEARRIVGDGVSLQGNLDPAVLRAPAAVIEREARRVLDQGRSKRHIFNLGHGIQPDTPVDSMYKLVEVVKSYRPSA